MVHVKQTLREAAYDFSTWTGFIPESEIRRLLRYQVKYYFGGGKPGIVPVETFAKILKELSERQLKDVAQGNALKVINEYNYGPTQGIQSFREVLAKRLRSVDNLDITADDVLITTGSQQCLYAILDVLIDPGDVIITTAPVYLGFVSPAEKLGAQVICVPTDLEGIVPEYVEEAILKSIRDFAKKPEIIYVVPDSDNPKGTTMPYKRRETLFEIAEEHNILIIEDAAYKEIQFGELKLPAIKTFDEYNTRVAYLRTTSKEAAVFRVGYSVMPRKLMEQVVKDKGFLDLCTATIVQEILSIYYEKYIDKVLPDIVKGYKERRDTMVKTIDEYFPSGLRTDPTGGFFVWWESENDGFDSKRFLERVAIPNDILYVPGHAFYPLRGLLYDPSTREFARLTVPRNAMRINYSFPTPQLIREGISRLGDLLKKEIG